MMNETDFNNLEEEQTKCAVEWGNPMKSKYIFNCSELPKIQTG